MPNQLHNLQLPPDDTPALAEALERLEDILARLQRAFPAAAGGLASTTAAAVLEVEWFARCHTWRDRPLVLGLAACDMLRRRRRELTARDWLEWCTNLHRRLARLQSDLP